MTATSDLSAPAESSRQCRAAFGNALDVIGAVEPTVADAIRGELADQRGR